MEVAEIVALVSERCADVHMLVASEESGAPEVAWGDVSCTYAPAGAADADPARQPFVTIVVGNYPGFDTTSRLDRDGVFRLNAAVGRRAFDVVLGEGWAERDVDPAALDVLMPHPVYAPQGWVSILNPSEGSRATVEKLLVDAYDRAVAQDQRRGA